MTDLALLQIKSGDPLTGTGVLSEKVYRLDHAIAADPPRTLLGNAYDQAARTWTVYSMPSDTFLCAVADWTEGMVWWAVTEGNMVGGGYAELGGGTEGGGTGQGGVIIPALKAGDIFRWDTTTDATLQAKTGKNYTLESPFSMSGSRVGTGTFSYTISGTATGTTSPVIINETIDGTFIVSLPGATSTEWWTFSETVEPVVVDGKLHAHLVTTVYPSVYGKYTNQDFTFDNQSPEPYEAPYSGITTVGYAVDKANTLGTPQGGGFGQFMRGKNGKLYYLYLNNPEKFYPSEPAILIDPPPIPETGGTTTETTTATATATPLSPEMETLLHSIIIILVLTFAAGIVTYALHRHRSAD